jgi:hypothetical protein
MNSLTDVAAPVPTPLEFAQLPALLPEPAPKPEPSVSTPKAPGQIEIELNGARLQLRGAVDLKVLRVVMEALAR